MHFEQQKPMIKVLRTGLAEKEQTLLPGRVFLTKSSKFEDAFFIQFVQQTPKDNTCAESTSFIENGHLSLTGLTDVVAA